ncbi:MAG: cytochrome c-type biogenesis protein CcmH, partial [Chloroflexota bacterium]|nr:cytochrome c-type biogenesis protein CcmH [Chloroflexota bacterium]
ALSANRRLLLVALFLLVSVSFPMVVAAQAPQGEPTVNDVAKELYCPLCAGLTVDVCELEVCDDMRAVIAERLEAGESPQQIKAYFAEQYGQTVLGKPSTEGFHLTAWVMPFFVLVGAALILFAWLRNRADLSPTPTSARVVPSGDYDAQLERELQRLDES